MSISPTGELNFNTFKWGSGNKKILITHGWGSKAADFVELITALLLVDDVQVLSFDAPGNGSSEGELSDLILFVQGVEAMIKNYGRPEVVYRAFVRDNGEYKCAAKFELCAAINGKYSSFSTVKRKFHKQYECCWNRSIRTGNVFTKFRIVI